jgi:hypothetical protein
LPYADQSAERFFERLPGGEVKDITDELPFEMTRLGISPWPMLKKNGAKVFVWKETACFGGRSGNWRKSKNSDEAWVVELFSSLADTISISSLWLDVERRRQMEKHVRLGWFLPFSSMHM